MDYEATGEGQICRRHIVRGKQRDTTQTGTTTTTMTPPPRCSCQFWHHLIWSRQYCLGSGRQGGMTASDGYTQVTLAVFAKGYILVLLGSLSFYFVTITSTDKDMAALGAAQQFLGCYGGGGGFKLQKNRKRRMGAAAIDGPYWRRQTRLLWSHQQQQ